MKLGYCILYVGDVGAAVAFYQEAFGLEARMIHDSGTYAEMDTGTTVLAFAARDMLDATGKATKPPERDAPSFEIALVADDVAVAYARAIAAGARAVSKPKPMPWDQTVSYVADAEGFLVEICSPIDPASG